MKKSVRLLNMILAAMLIACMMFAFTSCGETNTGDTSKTKSTHKVGDADFGDSDDDEDTVVNEGGVSVTKKNTSGGGSAFVDNGQYGGKDFNYSDTIDEEGKAAFLKKVPKSLKGQTVTIMIWWPTLPFEKAKMETFTKETGIKIKWLYVHDNYMSQLSALKMQRNAPDIAAITGSAYPTAIIQDYFQPITNGKLHLNDKMYDKASMQQLAWGGKQYGVLVKGTSHTMMGFMLYNADMFKKAGVTDPYTLYSKGNWNWDTFVSTSQQIQKKAKITAAVTCEYHAIDLVGTCGEDAVAMKNGKLVNNIKSKTYRDCYKWINDLTSSGQYKILNAGLNRDSFMSGKTAMMIENSWALQKGERYENLSFSLGYVPLPCPKGKKQVVSATPQLWGFPVGAKHIEAASYALEYWMNPAYDEAGSQVWINNSAAAFINSLWEMPKVNRLFEGIITYGGDYKYVYFTSEMLSGKANVDSLCDKWSNIIDSNLKKIYS
ncbi:MAG: ABC transporter substrate-binding protein, partial [Acutalibacteraceae bacterium]